MAVQTRTVKIIVDTKSAGGIQKLSQQTAKLNQNLKRVQKTTSGLGRTLSRLKTAFGGLAAAFGAREIVRSIDNFQLLQDRIKAVTEEGTDVTSTFSQLAAVARKTRQPIETVADGFARISISAESAGLSVEDSIKVTEALTQSLRLSGATTAEVNSVFLQFSQSLGLGRLQGQELRAVLLGNAKFSKLLAKELNTTKGRLREFGEQGKITNEVTLAALLKNFAKLNKEAGLLRITIGQGITIALDALRIKLNDLNKQFDITGNVTKGITILVDNLDSLAAVATALVATNLLTKLAVGIQGVIQSFVAGGVAGGALAAGPTALAAALGALALAALEFKKAADIERDAERFAGPFAVAAKQVIDLENELQRLETIQSGGSRLKDFGEYLKGGGKPVALQIIETKNELVKLRKERDTLLEKRKLELLKKKDLKNVKDGRTELQKLNATYDKTIGITEELIRKNNALERTKLEDRFKDGKVSAIDYTEQIRKLNRELEDLLLKYNLFSAQDQIFIGVRRGAEETLKSIGNLATQISKVTVSAFGRLEDSLFEFIKKGKFEFSKFIEGILDDITRLVIRLSIIRPIAQGIVGPSVASAKGNVFSGGDVVPFASGGVVNGPTVFPMTGGRTGLMGEAGPEAIIPLKRGPGGELGIGGSPTIVNVINNADGTETETRESTGPDGQQQIEIIVSNTVNNGLSEGRFDKSLNASFGLNRVGI